MHKELKISLEKIKSGGIILYPTDTVWGIGCDATNEKAISKIYNIKKRKNSKSLIILVDSIGMLKKYVDKVPEKAITILEKSQNPTTIIYKNPKGLAKNAIGSNKTVAIRIIKEKFCKYLISKFGKPIISTSANISKNTTPKSFSEISNYILNNVDHIVNLHHGKITNKPSTILSIDNNNIIEVLRE